MLLLSKAYNHNFYPTPNILPLHYNHILVRVKGFPIASSQSFILLGSTGELEAQNLLTVSKYALGFRSETMVPLLHHFYSTIALKIVHKNFSRQIAWKKGYRSVDITSRNVSLINKVKEFKIVRKRYVPSINLLEFP